MKYLSNILLLAFVLTISGCTSQHSFVGNRIRAAERIGERYHFTKRLVKGDRFWIQTYQKIIDPERPYVIYLEGDGLAFKNKYTISDDPTPVNPVMLRLAGLDPRPNVIYIARPCQYVLDMNEGVCTPDYWTYKRLSPEIVTAVNDVITKIVGKHPISLIGISSGGGMAVLIAARNPRVTSIITIAGVLDHATWTKYHNVRPLLGSLNPIDYVSKVTKIPQMHWSGGKDKVIPPFIADEFVRAAQSPCVHQEIIQDATHTMGWEKVWEYVLSNPARCYSGEPSATIYSATK